MTSSLLTEDDVQYLNQEFPDSWNEIVDDSSGIIVKNFSLPLGYNIDKVELLIIIPNDYPMAALDMFYLYPEIHKKNRATIEALTNEIHFGKQWQRWSRHYSWLPGIHCLATHMKVVRNSLEEELLK